MRRASFIALGFAVVGVVHAGLGVSDLLVGDSTGYAFLGVSLADLLIAGFAYRHPEQYRSGSEPVPRRWYELAAFLAILLALALAVWLIVG
ncbi:hypothetical protein VB773_05815 [Haloarculaceae archaeon H-GB2-1]|nr:hypothetical protein [Haloarculaceae archaeon H-GB1-1]MEA5389081.1 hypothetical protein [Haloarculaceae archaeon H-GB11]MEA5407143.1 hypothetical protein [Haloarculaceae archaeon H-GB2-1]